MGDSGLRYDLMVEGALRSVMRDALRHAAKHGLPGAHHFYLSFRTGYPGVQLDAALRARFPEEMTIVLQHQFWDLKVEQDGFAVTLSFANAPQRLAIPFAAVTAFNDPSVNFGLQFQSLSDKTANKAAAAEAPASAQAAAHGGSGSNGASNGASTGNSSGTPKPLPHAPSQGNKAARPGAVTPLPKPAPAPAAVPAGDKVVTLDSFRKK